MGPTKIFSQEAATKRRGYSIARAPVPEGKFVDQLVLLGSKGDYACNDLVRERCVYHWPLINCGYDAAWFMHRSCACNHFNALFGRVGMPVPRPTFRHAEVVPLISSMVASIGRCRNIPYEAIVASYRGMKRRRYEEARINLIKQGDRILRKDCRVNMFIKQEAIRFKREKVEPDCRAIQFRSFEYTLYLASRIKMCEHRMYELSDVPGFGPGRIFAKNMTDLQCGEALRQKFELFGGNTKVYMFDVERCDAHINNALQRIEHEVFMGANPSQGLRNALEAQLVNRGSFAVHTNLGYFRQKYQVRGTRMSGDSNTSGGTCIIIAVLLALFGQKYYPGMFSFLCNGDDSAFFFAGDWMPESEIRMYFARFGISIKLEAKTTEFAHVDFCQSRPVRLRAGWTMVRNPEKVLTKIGLTNLGMSLVHRANYVRTVALGELSRLRGVPVIQPFLLRLIRDCEGVVAKHKGRLRLDMRAIRDNYRFSNFLPDDWMSARTDAITSEARQGYALAWGMCPYEQELIENRLRNRSLLPTGRQCGRPIESYSLADWVYDWERTEIV